MKTWTWPCFLYNVNKVSKECIFLRGPQIITFIIIAWILKVSKKYLQLSQGSLCTFPGIAGRTSIRPQV